MSEPEMIYFAEEEVIITAKWAIFDKKRYSMTIVETALMEERYLNLTPGGLIALLGLILLILAPAIIKIVGFLLIVIGVENLRRRSFVVVMALSSEMGLSDALIPEEKHFFEDVYATSDRKMAQGIVDAIKVAKLHRPQ